MGAIVNEPASEETPAGVAGVEVRLVIPGEPSFLRLARLAAADFGTRAGFTIEEIDDLRIAVDELCSAVMGYERVDAAITIVYRHAGAEVVVEGELACPDSWGLPPQSDLSRAIVSAVCDEHRMEVGDGTRRFRLLKRSAEHR